MKGKMENGKIGTLQVSFIDGMRRMELGWWTQIFLRRLYSHVTLSVTQLRLTPPGQAGGDEIKDKSKIHDFRESTIYV